MNSDLNNCQNEITNVFKNVNITLNNIDGWEGVSKESIVNGAKESLGNYDGILSSQLSFLNLALKNLDIYNELKGQIKACQARLSEMIDNEEDIDSIKYCEGELNRLKSELTEYKKIINSCIKAIVKQHEFSKTYFGEFSTNVSSDFYKYEVDEKGIVIKNDGLKRNGTRAEKCATLFQDLGRFPVTSEEISAAWAQNATVVEVDIINENGERTTMKIDIHKALAEDIKEIFSEIADMGFKIKASDTSDYNARKINGKDRWSHHSYGTAIDINSSDNPNYYSATREGTIHDPTNNEYAITNSIANVFRKYGWSWGGEDWTNPHDYMHFSFAEIDIAPGVKEED